MHLTIFDFNGVEQKSYLTEKKRIRVSQASISHYLARLAVSGKSLQLASAIIIQQSDLRSHYKHKAIDVEIYRVNGIEGYVTSEFWNH